MRLHQACVRPATARTAEIFSRHGPCSIRRRHQTQWTNGKYNTPEYGTVKDVEQFKATLAYSPLHNVQPHTAYSAMLMTTGVNAPRGSVF